MQLLRQTWSEMRRQPVISAVTLFGTALAIFLIMIVVMMQDLNVMSFAPESNRDRFLHARYFHIDNLDGYGNSSGSMGYVTARKIYDNLESAETTTFYTGNSSCAIGLPDKPVIEVDKRQTDGNFWHVFDFTFVSGRPYTQEEMEAYSRNIVISESVARELFGTTDVAGREIMIDHFTPYTIGGVVKDVPTMASSAYASVWMPLSENARNNTWSNHFGNIEATILARDKSDFDAIRKETDRRKEAFNNEIKESEGKRLVDHGSPFTQDVLQYVKWSNQDPEYESEKDHKTKVFIYSILLLIPAINLSSMTQSRLRRRVSEMGVRRAFGCTRWRLVREIITENLLVTLAGGLIGLLASIVMAWLCADTLFANNDLMNTSTNLTPGMLLQWPVFFWALAACFVLNLLSSSIPAWRASRLNPTEAIGGLQK